MLTKPVIGLRRHVDPSELIATVASVAGRVEEQF